MLSLSIGIIPPPSSFPFYVAFLGLTLYIALRQFIVGLGLLVFPTLPALALVASVFEYWVDKYRMLRVCQKPKR